jgi:hypothetical protein
MLFTTAAALPRSTAAVAPALAFAMFPKPTILSATATSATTVMAMLRLMSLPVTASALLALVATAVLWPIAIARSLITARWCGGRRRSTASVFLGR